MSTALMVGVLIDMGQNSHLGRLVARDPDCASGSLSRVLLNKLGLGVLAAAGVAVVLSLLGFSTEEVGLVALMGVWATVLSMLDSMRAVARATSLMALDSAVNGLESLGRLAAIVVAWALGSSVSGYAAAYVLEAIVACVLFALALRRKTSIRLGIRRAIQSTGLLGKSWALGIMGMAMAGFYRVDQIVVQGFAGAAENGLYGAATRVAFTASVGGSLVMMAAYPELSRAAVVSGRYPRVFRRTLVLSVGVGLAIGLVVLLAASPIVSTLYGGGFTGAVPLLRILSLVVVGNSLTLVGMYSASALGREHRAVLLASVMIGVNLTANLVLVPRFGALGAAWVSAVGELIMAGGMLYLSADVLFRGRIRKEDVVAC